MDKRVSTTNAVITASELRDHLIKQAGENDEFRARLLANPKATVSEDYGFDLPENLNLYVHEEDATTAHLVLPRSKKLTEAELQAASGAMCY